MMNISFILLFLITLASCSSKPPMPSDTPFTSTWVKVHKNPDQDKIGKITIQVISDGTRFKIDEKRESDVDGNDFLCRSIHIFDGKKVYWNEFPMLSPKIRLDYISLGWIKFISGSDRQTIIEKARHLKNLKFWIVSPLPKKSPGEFIAGRKTSVWSGKLKRQDGEIEATVKAWIDDETGIALKIIDHEEYQVSHGGGSQEYSIECTSIRYGPLQSADSIGLLTPDADYVRTLKNEWLAEDSKMRIKHRETFATN
jgi:hypothetical protein